MKSVDFSWEIMTKNYTGSLISLSYFWRKGFRDNRKITRCVIVLNSGGNRYEGVRSFS